VSNFLGKLKEIIGGGQQDYQYYEDEIENLATQDSPQEENIVDSVIESKPEPPVESSTSPRRRQRDKSHLKMELPSPSYMDMDSNSLGSSLPNNVIGMPGVNNIVNEVVVIEPHSFDEIPQVIQTLKEQRCVVLNLNIMEPDEAQRAVDFVAGGTYAIDGHQERIGESIFLFTPRNVKVSTVSGNSYQVREPMGSSSVGSSFSESLWDNDPSPLSDSIAQ
jgi:cell division inhibitor SepF